MKLKNEEARSPKEEPTPGFYIKARYVLAVMLFSIIFNMFSTRSNLNVAIVAMVNKTTNGAGVENPTQGCPVMSSENTTEPSSNGIFQWNAAEQGILLSSYYCGYIVTNIPGAWLCQRFGSRWVMFLANVLTTALTLLTPVAAYHSFGLLLALRVVLGLIQGPILPSTFVSWGPWAPRQEQTILIATTFSGISIGNCFSLAFSGIIAAGFGWEGVFYITGGVSALITVLWFFLVYDSPDEHPRISDEEKRYINDNTSTAIGKNKDATGTNDDKEKADSEVPWISICTSLPVIAMMVGNFCLNYGGYTLLTMLPTYMATILMYDLASSGIFSALPFIIEWILTIGVGYITDLVRHKKLVSTEIIRKVNTAVGELVPALFVVLAGYIGCNSAAAIAFFTLAVGFQAATTGGCRANAVDIAPAYAGVVFGLTNTLGNIPGFLAPLVSGFVLEADDSIRGWQTIFWISAGVYVFGALVFAVFGSGKEQTWASITEDEKQVPNEGVQNSAFYEDTHL